MEPTSPRQTKADPMSEQVAQVPGLTTNRGPFRGHNESLKKKSEHELKRDPFLRCLRCLFLACVVSARQVLCMSCLDDNRCRCRGGRRSRHSTAVALGAVVVVGARLQQA